MFGLNYVTVYLAERSLASGIVAVIFSLSVFCNLIGARLAFGTPIQPAAMAGADKLLLISGTRVGARVVQHQAAIDAAVAAGVGPSGVRSTPRGGVGGQERQAGA